MSKDEIKRLAGDERAEVAVTLRLSDANFGKSFSGSATVKLTCDQSEKSLELAAGIATSLAEEFTNQAFNAARELYDGKEPYFPEE